MLRDAGFDMDLGGKDITCVQYQNANNSVRVSDEFMRAVEDGAEFGLRARIDGEVIETVDAKKLFRKDHPGGVGVRRPGHPVRRHDQRLAHQPGDRAASTRPTRARSTCTWTTLVQPGVAEPHEVPRATTARSTPRRFVKAVELVITAMDISICFADFPTEPIGETTRAYRQLGIGYANLGALLMATGHAYDSEGGRSLAAAITSLMTGTAYRRSAELAGVVGAVRRLRPQRRRRTQRVMRKHAAANDDVRTFGADDADVLKARDRRVAEAPRHRRATTAGATRRPRCSPRPAPSA